MYEEKHVKESPFVGMAGFGGGGTSTTLLSGGGESGWIMKLGGQTTNEMIYGRKITKDSQDNLYFLADQADYQAALSLRKNIVSKYTKDGEIVTNYTGTDHWQRFFTVNQCTGYGIVVLSDDSKFYHTFTAMNNVGNLLNVGIVEWLSNGFGTLNGIRDTSGNPSHATNPPFAQYVFAMTKDSNDNLLHLGIIIMVKVKFL